MSAALRLAPSASLLALALAPPLAAQAQPVDAYFADNWNGRYQRFSDLDGDGQLETGEVSLHMEAAIPGNSRARTLRVVEQGGEVVSYWLHETADTIYRGVDTNGDGTIATSEATVFRDSGALDGASVPTGFDVADDGAVWWSSAYLISQTVNGLVRLADLNADDDAGDAGEMVVLVDGNGPHPVEHDLGTATVTGWGFTELAAAGDGVIAYESNDAAVYRFEDFNGDGDVLDAGESILLLNATGERADLPQNPDFVDGTLKDLQTLAGYPTSFWGMATAVENGERAFYFGTSASPFNASSSTNSAGQGLNFLILRGVDGNGDGDINDAGEVTTFYDGSYTDGSPDLLILRGLDVLDGGTVYAVGLQPYPALFPGPNGNTWIHRFEDLDGDGDGMDAGERQLEIFDLAVHGYDPVVFPTPPVFGDFMSDPWDFSVRRLTPTTDMGGGTVGSNGAPTFTVAGALASGAPVSFDVTNAPSGALMLSWMSLTSSPFDALGGTVYTIPYFSEILWVANGSGDLSLPTTWPVGLPSGLDVFMQFVVQDAGQIPGLLLTNAQKLTTP